MPQKSHPQLAQNDNLPMHKQRNSKMLLNQTLKNLTPSLYGYACGWLGQCLVVHKTLSKSVTFNFCFVTDGMVARGQA